MCSAPYQLPEPSQSDQGAAAQLSAGPAGARSSGRSHAEHVVPGKGCARQVGLCGEHCRGQENFGGAAVADSGMCSPHLLPVALIGHTEVWDWSLLSGKCQMKMWEMGGSVYFPFGKGNIFWFVNSFSFICLFV